MTTPRLAAAVAATALAVGAAGGFGATTPKAGGTVAIAWDEPVCLNPFGPCDLSANSFLLTQVLEGAFEVGPDLRYRPNLVSGVGIVSRRPFTLVYRIRPEARWSDGVPVTAQDFVFTHRIFRDYENRCPCTDLRPWYRKIRRVVPLGQKRVRVVFRSRFANWRELFHLVLPHHALAGEDVTAVWRTTIDNPKNGRAIGSGPFLVGSWERGKQLTLVRNPRYWGSHKARLDRLVFPFPPTPPTGAEALRSRLVDLVTGVGWDAADLKAVRAVPGLRVVLAPALAFEHFAVRLGPGGHPALKNRLVRRALAYGLDRAALARAAWSEGAYRLDNAVLMSNTRFYEPNWSRYRHDPARARRLLDQAGCRLGGDRIYVCAGRRLTLRFLTTAGVPPRQRILELARDQLRRVGIEVEPTYAPGPVLFETILPRGEFDVALFRWIFTPAGFSQVYECANDSNYTGYCSRLTDRDLAQADRSIDARKRAQLLNAADLKLARDVPAIPLAQVPLVVAYRSSIQNVVPNPTLEWITWNAENWWLQR